MDEFEAIEEGTTETVGETLRAAREAQGKSIEDVASATRIPTRHLTSIEESDWSRLPAPTYTVGFAKNYAGELGLDKGEIGDRLRTEMGGTRPAQTVPAEYFAPTDPKRSMPIGLVLGAIVGIVLIALALNWLLNRDLADDGTAPAAENIVAAAPVQPAPATPPVVLITANAPAWVDIRDGETILKQGELGAGQSFEVPASAAAPTLTTAKPEALRISVGTADAPPIGQPGTRVENVSLKPDALMRGPTARVSTASPAPAPAGRSAAPRARAQQAPPAPAVVPPPAAEPATINIAQ